MEKSHEVSTKTCLMCDEHMEPSTVKETCDDCTTNLSNPAFLVCNHCLDMWSIVDPGPMKFGLEIKAGGKYHTIGCPYCVPGEIDFKIVEIEGFQRSCN